MGFERILCQVGLGLYYVGVHLIMWGLKNSLCQMGESILGGTRLEWSYSHINISVKIDQWIIVSCESHVKKKKVVLRAEKYSCTGDNMLLFHYPYVSFEAEIAWKLCAGNNSIQNPLLRENTGVLWFRNWLTLRNWESDITYAYNFWENLQEILWSS